MGCNKSPKTQKKKKKTTKMLNGLQNYTYFDSLCETIDHTYFDTPIINLTKECIGLKIVYVQILDARNLKAKEPRILNK